MAIVIVLLVASVLGVIGLTIAGILKIGVAIIAVIGGILGVSIIAYFVKKAIK